MSRARSVRCFPRRACVAPGERKHQERGQEPAGAGGGPGEAAGGVGRAGLPVSCSSSQEPGGTKNTRKNRKNKSKTNTHAKTAAPQEPSKAQQRAQARRQKQGPGLLGAAAGFWGDGKFDKWV